MEYLSKALEFIQQPFLKLEEAMGWELPPWALMLYTLFAVVTLVALLYLVYGKFLGSRKKDKLVSSSDLKALLDQGPSLIHEEASVDELRAAIPLLKKNKAWDRLGNAYGKTGNPKLAAKYFKKAGDFDSAGKYFLEAGKPMQAAKMFTKQGSTALAAEAYGHADKISQAIDLFKEYFQNPRDEQEAQLAAADACFAMLQRENTKENVSDEDKKALFPNIAHAFEQAERHDVAAKLYQESGHPGRAAEVYVISGNLEAAANCYKAAGMTREAARIGGRFYEGMQRWKEAAQAYLGAEEYMKAGECFGKAKEPVRAGECFERAGSFFNAGLAYCHASRYENAVSTLQRVPENDPNFDMSRALLGRAFYESHDYPHAVATLDNHLLGKRVEKGNIDYFYMLGLAKEQLGELDESKKIFLKIGAVDKTFRDLDMRVSSIESRISILKDQTGSIVPGQAQPAESSTDAKIMGMVENTLGERYEFQKELGRGGMGVVYLARDRQLDRKVALKFLGSLVDQDEDFKQRFLREARSAAKINHPNIVAIYDISASEGKAYIAMEFIEGPNLFQYIRSKKKLEPREAANFMSQACAALGAMHQVGVVHRDIKPDNIVLAKGGLVKIMDFGLAKSGDSRITQANMVVGTPAYMPPEQARGKETDGRGDIYAMGLVLYEMLTGKTVFKDGDILRRQVQEVPPRPREVDPNISTVLDNLIMKCLEKDPDKRYQKAEEVVAALRGSME